MGLFDGASTAPGRRGATADLAAHFSLPVVLVLDVSRQAQSAAAVVRGFATHDPAVRIAGVILNRVASERHSASVGSAIATLDIPVLGAVPRAAELTLPERHLGLVQAGEHPDLTALIGRLAAMAERHLDLDAIVASAAPLAIATTQRRATPVPPPGQRIALAHDQAFSFVYPHLLAAWRKAGAEIIPFSPLADEAPPERADSCWLPGGYPELHADNLAASRRFPRDCGASPKRGQCTANAAATWCSAQGIEDAAGKRHPMTGLLGHTTSFAKRKLHLGYRTARLLSDSVLGQRGATLRGHEFHYASLTSTGNDAPFAELADAEGRALGNAGGQRDRVSGTFFHTIAAAT